MGAEQSQEQTKDGEKPDASHQNLALQAAEKARAFAQGSSVRPSRRQAGAAGNAEQVVQRQAPSGRAGMQMNSAGRVPQQAAPQQGQDLAAQSKWAKLFEQAKEDEAREAAGEVVHPGIGPGGRTGPVFDVSQQQRQALERRNAAMAASAGRGAGEKTYGVKFWEKSGNKYEGEFVNGQYHGQGKLTYADGRSCEGTWVQGHLHGRGAFRYGNGDFYEGEFKGGVIDGHGRFVYRNGDTYVGAFRNGKRHGRGELKATTGDGFKGMWKEGKPDLQIVRNVHR